METRRGPHPLRLTAAAVVATAAAAFSMLGSPSASAAPQASPPAELNPASTRPVDPGQFRSYAYDDNGRSFLTTGRWRCQLGSQYRYVACQGRPATAPPATRGVAIAGDQSGPQWIGNSFLDILGPSDYRFGSRAGFRAPLLRVGQRVTIAGATCSVPRADVVACSTGSRAFLLTPRWHRFYYPAGDHRHDANPAPSR